MTQTATQKTTQPKPSILLGGLRLMLRHTGAVLWTFALNLGIAVLFSLRLNDQYSALLDHSLAAERLNSAFDLGTVLSATSVLSQAGGTRTGSSGGILAYFVVYFILVPGTLFTYQSDVPATLTILISSGLAFFWRFIRITLIATLTAAIILAPLLLAVAAWSNFVDTRWVEFTALELKLPLLLLAALIALLLRLYFDLVEVYTILLADHFRPSGVPDRRVRKVLLPALTTLGRNLPRALASYLFLALFGLAAAATAGWFAARHLAQPRVWPTFLIAQVGLFLLLAARFWQRATLCTLAGDNPLPRPEALLYMNPPPQPFLSERDDPQSNPEPASPSLPTPDPAVYHHDPTPNPHTTIPPPPPD